MITAVIIARNEEHQIAEAITSAKKVADKVVVVDDQSEDATAVIASELGAIVLKADPSNSGFPDRVFRQGFQTVESGWILRMDSDERVTDELANELKKVAVSEEHQAASFARLNYMFGDYVRHGGWLNPHQVGFFKADSWDNSWGYGIHQQVGIFGKIKVISPDVAVMEHLDYYTIEQFVNRSFIKYAKHEAQIQFENGTKFTKLKLVILPTRKSIGRYLVRKGYKDGTRGLILAILLGIYDAITLIYLWELEKKS